MYEQDQIRELATKFRQAILDFPRSAFPCNSSMGISKFPKACGGEASQTLATYIFAETGVVCSYVRGENGGIEGEIKAHAWLEIDGLVIDITAAQFNRRGYHLADVYVGFQTDWYRSYETSVDMDGRHTSLKDKALLDEVYETISSEL